MIDLPVLFTCALSNHRGKQGWKLRNANLMNLSRNEVRRASHKGMFNEDVGFQFEVKIKGTDRKDIEAMLNLFDRAATGFKETWQKKLASLH